MQIIWKWELETRFEERIASDVSFGRVLEMPAGTHIQFVGRQRPYVVTLWGSFLERDKNDLVERKFHVVGTGQPFNEKWVYVGSCIDEPYVWHVYEEINR